MSDKHDSVYMNERRIHVTMMSISNWFALFFMRGFQEGRSKKKNLQLVG